MRLGLGLSIPMLGTNNSPLSQLQSFGGLTFYKDYANSQTSANADYSVGSGTVTVTAARSASAPGTYFNSTGGILTLTTANVPRWTQGYYDATGFHSRPGIMVESGGSATLGRNVIVKSDVFADVAWTNSNITVNDAENDGVLSATVSSLTASAGDATLTQTFVLTSSKYTSSIFIKRKTGTGTISLRANTADSYTDITANVGSSWTRVSVVSSTAANPTFDIKITTSGDAIYVKGAQLENYPFMTSYIPTNTAARTRATELLAYETSGNRTAGAETSFVKFTPLGGNFANDSFQRTIIATATKNREIYKSNTSALARIAPNVTDHSGITAICSTTLLAGTSYVVAGACTHATPLPYARISIAGTSEGEYTSGDWTTEPAWGTTFAIGSTSGGASQLNGIIEVAAIYSNFKDVPDVNHISNIMDSSITYRNYLLLPDTSSSENVVSGGGTGNVLDNDTYDFNGKLIKTGSDTVLKFDVVGSDEDFNLGLRLQIKVRAYTISTNSWAADAVCYDITGQSYVIGSRIYRIVGSQIWMYMVKYSFPLDNTGILVLSKSTDLTGTSWGAESTIYTFSGSVGQVINYIDTSNPNLSYLMIARDEPPRKVHLLQTTDGGNTFSLGPVVYAQGSHTPGEGDCVALSSGRMLAIFRDSTQNYLIMMKSSDEGLTWSEPEDIVLGDNTDEKPTPKLIKCAGYPTRLTLFFYDRGDDRTRISPSNSEDDAFNNTWRAIYPLGTSSNGNGAICVTDDTKLKYLAYVAKATGDAPPQTDTLWWVWKDIYNWVAN